MELADILKEKGVTSLEELEAKIKADALKEKEAEEALLRKQIKDLEEIKAKQGDTIGTTRKELDEAKGKLIEMEKLKMEPEKILEKKPDDAPAQGKTQEQWRQENEAREKALTDEDWTKLDEAAKALDADTRKLALSDEEGRAAFMAEVLGSAAPVQETFRRPTQEKKLSVAEQIQQGLAKLKPNSTPSLRPSGSGFSANRQPVKQTAAPNPALLKTGSLRDMVAAHKGE
jgi:hypothetical protein